MNHPGYSSSKLVDMRRVLDEEPLSDRDRRAVQSALGEIEGEWQDRHRTHYQQGIEARDGQHGEVLDVAEQFVEAIAERRDDVRNGRRPANEVRAWLRDARAAFEQLTQQHRGIEASEEELAAFEGMDVAEFQADRFARFPGAMAGHVTLGQKIAEVQQRRHTPAETSGDTTDHQAIARELGRPEPPRQSAARRHGWTPR
jgi:hypothetical protein